MITNASTKIKEDQEFVIFHHLETDENGEDVDPDREFDEEGDRERFTMGTLCDIHGFHGKYAIISITTLDLDSRDSFYPLYWVDTQFLDLPAYLRSQAYQSHLQHLSFVFHTK
jgi:hypothetical protein